MAEQTQGRQMLMVNGEVYDSRDVEKLQADLAAANAWADRKHSESQRLASMIREMQVDLTTAQAELDELRAKLPKTADGVPLHTGMSVYFTWSDGDPWILTGWNTSAKTGEVTAIYSDGGFTVVTGGMYSTREAAEAASQEGESDVTD